MAIYGSNEGLWRGLEGGLYGSLGWPMEEVGCDGCMEGMDEGGVQIRVIDHAGNVV